MSKFLNGVVPADIDHNAINMYPIGEFLIDRTAVDEKGKLIPTAYIALNNPDTNKKELYLVAGAGKYELIEHLNRAHVIGNLSPTNYDRSTLWFNTEMVYVEPSDVTKSYITIRTETSPGVWEWKKILPYTSMESVIIGAEDGETITLAKFIRNNRLLTTLPTNIREASYGELYVTDANELYFKQGPNPEDQHLVGVLSTYLRDRVVEQIKVGQEQPLNFNHNTTWFTDEGDVSLAKSKFVRFTDPTKSTGLKFTRDADNRMKSASTLENENKSVIIDNNSTTDYGHIWLNFPVNTNGKYYLELYVEDPNNVGQIMLFSDGVRQPILNDYGTQIDNSQALITTTKSIFGGISVNKNFTFHKKTIFIEITKLDQSCKIDLGYVTDSGVKNYIYGDGSSTNGFTMNLARIAVGSNVSYESNSYTRFSILPFLIKQIPDGFTGINNTLPGESPFNVYAIATNAQSVFINSTSSLSNLMENGRIIPVFRDYTDRNNARVNEIMLDSDRSKLYTKTRDGRVVSIAGALDEDIEDHLLNSLKVTGDSVSTFKKLDSDPRRIYISKNIELPSDPNLRIYGNMAVVDNSVESDDTTYKLVLPRTLSSLVSHTWTDSNSMAKNGPLKTYLDELDTIIKNAISKDNVYSGYEELNLRRSDLINTYNTQPSFIQEVAKRMLTNGLYIETVAKQPAGGVSSNQIDNFFSVPEDGIVYTYADANDHVYSTLLTKNGIYYKSFFKPTYDGSAPWKRVITELSGNTSVNNLLGEKAILNQTVESKNEMISPLLKLNGIVGAITANNKNITNDSANLLTYEGSSILDTLSYSIGDKKFKNAIIYSKQRPTWINDNGIESPWLTTEDIRNSWNYKGSLINNSVVTDLNTLNSNTSNGYYILNGQYSNGSNYPELKLTGVLNNYKIDDTSFQVLIGKGTNGNRIYIRNYDTKWNRWEYLVNNKDLDTRLPISGGNISGNLDITGNLNISSNLNSSNLITNTILGKDNNSIIQKPNNNTLTIGNNTLSTITILGTTNSPVYNNGTKNQRFMLEDDFNNINNTLTTSYYTKNETDKFLDKKVDKTEYENDMLGKVNRTGDNMTGTLTMDAGNIDIKQGAVIIQNNAKLTLPGEHYASRLVFNQQTSLSKYLNNVRYETVNLSTDNEMGVLTFSLGRNGNVTSNTPTSIRIMMDKKGNLSVSNIVNNSVVGTTRSVVMKDEIDNDFTGGTDKVLSAEKGKELSEATIGKFRGNLYDVIGVGINTSITVFNPLKAGYYLVTTQNEMRSLGLNSDIVTADKGILLVEGESNRSTRVYRYITQNTNSAPNNKFTMGIRVISEGVGEWKYIYDITQYYTKTEIDEFFSTLEAKVLTKIISPKYSFTGHTTNNSIPRKLVHTHNHETLGDSDTLYFKTNISGTGNKNFVIELDGFAMGSAIETSSSPIKVYISGRIENNDIRNINILNAVPGSALLISNVKLTTDKFVTFSVKDKVSNRNLSFDTYMRFSSITDTTFDGAITLYRTTPIN